MSVIRNTEVTVIRSQLCNTSNGHASGTPANRPYNGGVRNSEARNIERHVILKAALHSRLAV